MKGKNIYMQQSWVNLKEAIQCDPAHILGTVHTRGQRENFGERRSRGNWATFASIHIGDFFTVMAVDQSDFRDLNDSNLVYVV